MRSLLGGLGHNGCSANGTELCSGGKLTGSDTAHYAENNTSLQMILGVKKHVNTTRKKTYPCKERNHKSFFRYD